MTKTTIKVVLFSCVVAGLLFFFYGHRDVGICVVIAGYVLYIVVRLIPKRKRTDAAGDEETEEEAEEPKAAPDSWEEMREKALEALSRRLRGQKIMAGSFFRPAHAEFPALVKAHSDILEQASELVLKTDFEALKVGLNAQETENLLKELAGKVETEEDLQREMRKLHGEARE